MMNVVYSGKLGDDHLYTIERGERSVDDGSIHTLNLAHFGLDGAFTLVDGGQIQLATFEPIDEERIVELYTTLVTVYGRGIELNIELTDGQVYQYYGKGAPELIYSPAANRSNDTSPAGNPA